MSVTGRHRFARTLATSCALVLGAVEALAHSPHHVVADVATAAAGDDAQHTYILITDQIFRSDDDGASWKNLVNGLNNQHSFTAVAVSPAYSADGTVFAATSGDGVFRSTDFGDSWRRVDTGLGRRDIHALSVSPVFSSDGRVIAADYAGGLWLSADGGVSWQRVLNERVVIRSVAELPDSGGQVLYAGDVRGRIWRSQDGGQLWEIRHEIADAGEITALEARGDSVFAGTSEKGLFRSPDAGETFESVMPMAPPMDGACRRRQPAESGRAGLHVTSVVTAPGTSAAGRRVLVTAWYGAVYVSEDDGTSWKTWHRGLSCDPQADQLNVAHFRDIAIGNGDDDRMVYWLAAYDGIFRSEAYGYEWHQRESLPLGLIKGMAVTAGPEQPLATALSTYGGGFYLLDTADGQWTIGNRGLRTTRLTGLEFSPRYAENGILFAGARNQLLKSTDRGRSWHAVRLYRPNIGTRILNKLDSFGLPTGWLRSKDAGNRARVYPTDLEYVPLDERRRILIASRYHGLLAYSEADEDVDYLWPETRRIMTNLVVSPAFVSDQTVFASIRGKGAFRSQDGGKSWTAINDGLGFVSGWADDAGRGDFRSDVHLAISPGYATDAIVFAGSPNGDGLYVTRNGGNSWQRVDADFGLEPAPVLAIALSPRFAVDRTVMVSIKGAGLFRSIDGGTSFEKSDARLIERNASIEWLAYSPHYAGDMLMVAASDESLFLSQDGGSSWSPVPRPVRYEDMRHVVRFSGRWTEHQADYLSAQTEMRSSEPGSRVRVEFVGGGFRWIGSRGPGYGSAQVYVDGALVDTVALATEAFVPGQVIVTVDGLGPGPHDLEVRVPAPAPGIDNGIVSIDAVDILPAEIRRDQ